VAQDAYGLALQDKHFKVKDIQELMVPITRRSILHRCITEKITKQVQFLIQSTFDSSFIHPHIYNNLARGKFQYTYPLEPMLFDARFMFPVLMVARWFSKTCMRKENYISNNQAHLVLYGSAGTGKSLIVSAISSCVSTYKYITGSKF
jgi:Cdc6-like AAA superfamily ATPase